MTENIIEPKADAQGDKLDAIMSLLGKTISRLDEMETKSNLPAPPLVTAADKKAKADEDKEEEMKADEAEEAKPVEKSDSEGKVEMPAGEMKFDESKSDEDKEEFVFIKLSKNCIGELYNTYKFVLNFKTFIDLQ